MIRWTLIACCLLAAGCGYLHDRVNDLSDVGMVGITITRTPQFSAYINCPTVIPLGYGKIDGWFWGIGDGQRGIVSHRRREAGYLLLGGEAAEYGYLREAYEGVGLLSLIAAPGHSRKRPMCVHHLHVGWIGAVVDIRWWEIPDALLGWVLIDYMNDDGR